MITVQKSLIESFGPARDQGPRPTCLLFAASDNHAANRIGWSPLSVEYLCFHTGDASAGITHGVALNDALASLKKSGQPIESDYPYQLNGPLNSPPAFSEDRLFRCDGKQLTATIDDITSPIAAGHPVLIVMSISDAFYTPGPDAYVSSSEPVDPSRIHAVIGTGIGFANGRTCIQVRNSWGAGWGAQGYSWIDSDYLSIRLYQTATLEVGDCRGILAA
jgi:hypothetical protein